jgi:hypothetical protein
VDEQKQTAMFDVEDDEDGKLLLQQRMWIKHKTNKPSYNEAEPLLYFLDKYATIVVGGARAMGKYYKQNRGKSLLDKLTVSDIAYSLLVFESSHDVWKEEILKAKTCATAEEKKSFEHTAVNKYHVKRGTRLPVYQDGWTSEGQEYFKTLCGEVDAIKRNNELWTCLKVHWATYVRKYHNTFTYQAMVESDEGEKENNTNNDSDEDCLVSLPGELGVEEEMALNEDELEETTNDCEQEEDDDERHFAEIDSPIQRGTANRRPKKLRRVVPV